MPDQLAVFKSLQHPTRLEILKFLGDHPQDIVYTDLLPFCDESTGKLNYHLRTLDDLVIKNDNGYNLSEKGRRVLNWLNSYENVDEIVEDFERPEIIFNKIYPAKLLLYKMWLQGLLISIIPILGSLLLMIVFQLLWLFVIVFIGTILSGISMKLYFDSIWYRITETEIEVFKGLITHTHKIVPFRTVTNVDYKQGVFDRLFGISTINIHTAGYSSRSFSAEEQIIGMIEGEEIKDTIMERIRLLNPVDFFKSEVRVKTNLRKGLQSLKDELKLLNKEMNEK